MFDYKKFIESIKEEDIRSGDHSTLASIPADLKGVARFIYKDNGVLAGLQEVKHIVNAWDASMHIDFTKKDGEYIEGNKEIGIIEGSVHTILQIERTLLNIMQRMSGIASLTRLYKKEIEGTDAQLLDTRKTTPLIRYFEKEAVRIGGGQNHRAGLYDMIMLKDNHIDFSGGISKALDKTYKYLSDNNLNLKVEVECSDLNDVKEVLSYGKVDRIMLDNFTPEEILEALPIINRKMETEASGGINLKNIRSYALTGVDYISIGALTHQATSKDISLKAEF